METYKVFVVLSGNTKTTQEVDFHPISPVIKYQAREDLEHKEAHKDLVAPSDKILKAK